ncbi:Glutamine ABC transporter [Pseudomonas syringae pv. maculicola]|nr:Glutamine ABC transporter [Pseudomonas syringae pv. maculicola]
MKAETAANRKSSIYHESGTSRQATPAPAQPVPCFCPD